jgi:hypothetical protein
MSIRKEDTVACFRLLSRESAGDTEENLYKRQ